MREIAIAGIYTSRMYDALTGAGFTFGPDFGIHSEGTCFVIRNAAALPVAQTVTAEIDAIRRRAA